MIRPRLLVTSLATGLVTSLVATLLVASPASALPEWEHHRTTWTTGDTRQARVVGLRFASHDGFDRVVIDLRRAFPRGSAHYRRHFRYEGSGEKVPILGRSGLSVDLVSAAGHTYSGKNVYDGPRIARPHLDTLKAVALTGDTEGSIGFALALTHRADYRVFRLSHPRRLVIDVRHE